MRFPLDRPFQHSSKYPGEKVLLQGEVAQQTSLGCFPPRLRGESSVCIFSNTSHCQDPLETQNRKRYNDSHCSLLTLSAVVPSALGILHSESNMACASTRSITTEEWSNGAPQHLVPSHHSLDIKRLTLSALNLPAATNVLWRPGGSPQGLTLSNRRDLLSGLRDAP